MWSQDLILHWGTLQPSVKQSKAIVLPPNMVKNPLWVGNTLLPKVKECKCLRWLFMREETRDLEIDIQIVAASAVMQVLPSVMVKSELSMKEKLMT